MDSLYLRQQLMNQMMPQMSFAVAIAGPAAGPAGLMQQNQIAMALATNASLGMGWASYGGGMSAMSQAYGSMGSYGSMAMAFSMNMPGPYAMAMVGVAGPNSYGMDDQMIEVAGTGMGSDKKYKMLPGEMLATYSVLKEKGNLSPDDMAKQLKEKYGLDVEVKTEDGKKVIVNKNTGNVIMSDGNGNNIMEAGDMKFKESFEKLGLDIKDFDGKDGQAKLDYLVKSMMYGQGMGMGMGLGIGMGFNPFGSSAYGMFPPYGMPGGPGYDVGMGAPFTNPAGMMRPGGMMNDPRMMMMMMTMLMMALQYATMMQQGNMYGSR